MNANQLERWYPSKKTKDADPVVPINHNNLPNTLTSLIVGLLNYNKGRESLTRWFVGN